MHSMFEERWCLKSGMRNRNFLFLMQHLNPKKLLKLFLLYKNPAQTNE